MHICSAHQCAVFYNNNRQHIWLSLHFFFDLFSNLIEIMCSSGQFWNSFVSLFHFTILLIQIFDDPIIIIKWNLSFGHSTPPNQENASPNIGASKEPLYRVDDYTIRIPVNVIIIIIFIGNFIRNERYYLTCSTFARTIASGRVF